MKERKYKEPSFQINPKVGKILLYIMSVLRVLLIAGCIWGLLVLFGVI